MPNKSTRTLRTSPDSEWILVGESDLHGMGVYARRRIPKGTRIIEYTGEKITKAESDRRAERDQANGTVYLFTLNDRFDIDGAVGGCDARFINHSCDPNAETQIKRGRIWVVAIKDIAEGEEICYDYNFDVDDYKDHPCRCGAASCRGYIISEESHKRLKKEGKL